MTDAENEQRKLSANWLNIVSAGIMVTGAIVPLLSMFYQDHTMAGLTLMKTLLGSIGLAVASVILHLLARASLKELAN